MSKAHLRIGDAEREHAAAELAEHYAQGRLSVEEHSERIDQVWTARTQAELAPLFHDLPSPSGRVGRGRPPVGAPRPSPPARTAVRFPGWIISVLVLLGVVFVLTKLSWLLIAVAIVWLVFARKSCGVRRS